jgi:hypothetical protein
MKSNLVVDAGVCGFKTAIKGNCEDGQFVTVTVASGCEKISAFGKALAARGPVDAFQEISPASESVILATARESVKGCCSACAAVIATYKAMQVAAGLALPADISITMSRE